MPFCPEKGMGGGEAARALWYAYKRLRTEKQGDEARADGNLTSTQPIRQLFLWPHQIVTVFARNALITPMA